MAAPCPSLADSAPSDRTSGGSGWTRITTFPNASPPAREATASFISGKLNTRHTAGRILRSASQWIKACNCAREPPLTPSRRACRLASVAGLKGMRPHAKAPKQIAWPARPRQPRASVTTSGPAAKTRCCTPQWWVQLLTPPDHLGSSGAKTRAAPSARARCRFLSLREMATTLAPGRQGYLQGPDANAAQPHDEHARPRL